MRVLFLLAFTAIAAPAWAALPAVEQNALVSKYCAVCHSDAARNGGLSLEHYDASKRDPGLAAMILSKLNNGAMGAAGIGVPDSPIQQAWLQATREQAVGASEWFVTRQEGVVSAGIVQDVPPRTPASTDRPVYRLTMTCQPARRSGEMLLTWSPQPQTGRTMRLSVDGGPSIDYPIEGKESMGNGSGQSGHASVVFDRRDKRLGVANRSLRVSDLFPGETVEFSFASLDERTRSELRECFAQ